jgi:zona occludens toxin
MLAFNEGVPGSGKSYDAVVEHILPALRDGRRVAARLNGLNVEKIAAHLGKSGGEVDELLELVTSDQVAQRFVAEQNETGEWVLPLDLQNTLIIIDECHEFYVASRQALPPEVEQFFAMHRHYGVDIVLMSQFYKRLHSAVRGRIERKNVFQKMTAVFGVGLFKSIAKLFGLEPTYQVTFYTTVAPDRYEKVGSAVRTFKAWAFPLYQGVKEGASTEVYEGGGRSAWRQLLLPALVMVPLGVLAIGFFVWFLTGGAQQAFKGDKSTKVRSTRSTAPEPMAALQPGQVLTPRTASGKALPAAPALSPEQAYVFDLSGSGRPRLAAQWPRGDRELVLVEWRDNAGNPVELLDTIELEALGVAVHLTRYGVLLQAGKQRMVVTSWPTTTPVREQSARLYNLNPDAPGNFSFALPGPNMAAPASAPGGGGQPRIGDNYQAIAR